MLRFSIEETYLLINEIDSRIEVLKTEIAKLNKRSKNWTSRSCVDAMYEAWKEIEALKQKRNKLKLYAFGKELRDLVK